MTKELKNRILENKVLTYDERMEIIKALEQDVTDIRVGKIDSDCVSRQAVLDEIKSMSNANPSYWNHCDVVDREDLIDGIQSLPPVTPAIPSSNDCVSRKAVLDCLTATGLKKFDFILDAREKVNNLPPVTPTQRWIPVSERLPENEEDVLLSVNGNILIGYFKFDETCYDFGFKDLNETGWYDEHDEFLYNQDIDAWQPLPKPY